MWMLTSFLTDAALGISGAIKKLTNKKARHRVGQFKNLYISSYYAVFFAAALIGVGEADFLEHFPSKKAPLAIVS